MNDNEFINDLKHGLDNAVPPTITDLDADNHDKEAEWQIVTAGVWTYDFKCPLCSAGVVCCYLDTPKFCHNCGARMSFNWREKVKDKSGIYEKEGNV